MMPIISEFTSEGAKVISKELLDILVCPEDRSALSVAPANLVDQLNAAVAAGGLTNRSGELVKTPISGGLVRADGKYLYPIVDEIPILIVDEAIPLDQDLWS